MITFDFITIFPEIIKPYFEESLFENARKNRLLKVRVHDLRNCADGRHHKVDDRPYGGGFGMVMKVQPWHRAISRATKLKLAGEKLKPTSKGTEIILLTPRGKRFNQAMAQKLAKAKQLVFICGRYEGVDERVAKNLATMEVSVGDYDLMGGELAAMVMTEAVARLVPGVIGKPEFLKKRNQKTGFFESAQYTRPEIYSPKKEVNWRVPKVLLSGDPKKISAWRAKHGKLIS